MFIVFYFLALSLCFGAGRIVLERLWRDFGETWDRLWRDIGETLERQSARAEWLLSGYCSGREALFSFLLSQTGRMSERSYQSVKSGDHRPPICGKN